MSSSFDAPIEEINGTFCASAAEGCGYGSCGRERRRRMRRIWSARENGSENEMSERRRGMRSERRSRRLNRRESDDLAQVSPLLQRGRRKPSINPSSSKPS